MAPTDAFDRIIFRGRPMDKKTAAFVVAMEERLGYQLTIVQGCYSAGAVAASGGTHDGGGVLDLTANDHIRKVRVARELGAFAWYRPELPGVWGEHVHLGIRNHGRLSPAAQDQQKDYDAKPPRNGLANHAPDRTFHPSPPVTFKYPGSIKPTPKPNNVQQARDALAETIHHAGQSAALLEDTPKGREVAHAVAEDIRQARQALRAALDKLPKK